MFLYPTNVISANIPQTSACAGPVCDGADGPYGAGCRPFAIETGARMPPSRNGMYGVKVNTPSAAAAPPHVAALLARKTLQAFVIAADGRSELLCALLVSNFKRVCSGNIINQGTNYVSPAGRGGVQIKGVPQKQEIFFRVYLLRAWSSCSSLTDVSPAPSDKIQMMSGLVAAPFSFRRPTEARYEQALHQACSGG